MVGGPGAVGALALALSACGDSKTTAKTTPTTKATKTVVGGDARRAVGGDLGILNFALTLEHIESAYYRKVVASGVVKQGSARSLLQHIDANERRHVAVITEAIRHLGGTPAKAPETNFDSILHGGQQKVLQTAATLENVGAAAYLGQAAAIKNDQVLSTALGIHTVEARQAAALNEMVGRGFEGSGDLSGSVPDGAFAKPLTSAQAMRKIKSVLEI